MQSPARDQPLLRYRNREIRDADLAFIRSHMRAGTGRKRLDLAAELCEAWGWKQMSGKPSVAACLDLLLHLERRGLLERAPGQRGERQRKSLPVLAEDHIALSWVGLSGVPDLNELEVRPVEPEEREGFRLFMARYHYLGHGRVPGEQLHYAAFLEGELVALLSWGPAALRAPLRDALIGWDFETQRANLPYIVNNVRFLVLPWIRVKHLASKVLACSLRRLSRDWLATWNHPVHLAETFVDQARFRGTCYRAANWQFIGQTAGRSKCGNQYRYDSSPKTLLLYPLHRRWRQRLLEPRTPTATEMPS
jgi:hypothetical protein